MYAHYSFSDICTCFEQAMEKFTDGQEGMEKLRSVCRGWDDATIADVRGIFQMLDDNGDGVLDMNEL